MSQPGEHDRDRPLRLAIRSLRLMGLVCSLYGIFFVFAYGYFNRYERYRPYFMGMGMLLWVLPGVVFLVNCRGLELRQRRSAVYALIVAVLQGMAALGLFIANFFFTPISPIPVVMSALWVAAMVQLVVHLRRSLP